MFGHSDVPLFVSAQTVLMGFFTVSFQHWLMGTFSYTACFFTCCMSSSRAFRTKIGSNHPPLASSQYFLCRIEFSSCTICPPSLLRLRLFSIWEAKSKGLTCVPLAMCIVEDAWPASPTCCRRPSQISESRFSRRLEPSTFLAICGLFEAFSFAFLLGLINGSSCFLRLRPWMAIARHVLRCALPLASRGGILGPLTLFTFSFALALRSRVGRFNNYAQRLGELLDIAMCRSLLHSAPL